MSKSELSHSPHTIIPTLIEPNSIVLDVACNTGYMGKTLKNKGVISDGIDINDRALSLSRKYYRNLYKRDLYSGTLGIDKIQYDYIIFGDILEHLPRPDFILKDSRKYLKKNGVVIISIPNIARLEVRLQLLLGNFEYAPGILSPDHLRFFTRKSAIRLIESCGFTITKIVPTGLGHMIKILPTLTAFQFIYIGIKQDSPAQIK